MRTKIVSVVFAFIASFAAAAGVETLTLENGAYVDYLKRITHSRPFTLQQMKEQPASVTELIGKKVTVLGFARPVDGTKFFTRAHLVESTTIDSPVGSETPLLQFSCDKPVYFKPFEIYQVTGVLEKTVENGSDSLVVRARFAEPQESLKRIIFFPDLASEAALLPGFEWNMVDLPRNEYGELIENDPLKVVVPEKIKALAGQRVRFETWLLEPGAANFAPPASGSYYASLFVISDGICKCCGLKANYDMSNVGMLKPLSPLSDRVIGGIFMGTLVLNDRAEFATHGLFSINDAVLVRPLSLPGSPAPVSDVPKVDKKNLLPALLLQPKTTGSEEPSGQ